MLGRPDMFVGTMTEKLMIYALGRGLDDRDMPAVRAIVRDAAAHDYRFSSIVLGIVRSVPFQMRMQAGWPLSTTTRGGHMFISKVSLPRRTFLRGLGTAIALPFLDAMVPALHAAGQRRRRAAACASVRSTSPTAPSSSSGSRRTIGAGFEFTPILKPLEPFKDSLVVVNNLTRSHPGSQVGDHAVSAAAS